MRWTSHFVEAKKAQYRVQLDGVRGGRELQGEISEHWPCVDRISAKHEVSRRERLGYST
jgi:hypothetical protein